MCLLWPPTVLLGGEQVGFMNFESSLSSMGNYTRMPAVSCVVDTFLPPFVVVTTRVPWSLPIVSQGV